ncbi:hypothetical protein V490_06180 [Pseudogymnoascus sp. VKM F-3557]|nr:hypothetical protein V490_06180 [Pseudogymnoascus sp. VKM F-3557]
MCGDSHLPPAPSVGDAVAVIHMRPDVRDIAMVSEQSWRCQLSNYFATAEEANTKLIYEAKPDWWRGDMKVRIYAYGTPSDAREGGQHNPILQQMLIPFNETNSSSVGRKLELYAGGDGIIGRTMSVERRITHRKLLLYLFLMDMELMNHDAMASPKAPAMSDAMEMGGMSMSTIFNTNTHVTLFFIGWSTTTVASYIATIICLFLLTIFNRFLAAVKFQTERAWLEQAQTRNILPPLRSVRNGRLFFKAKLSPVPTSMIQDNDLECDPLTSPTDGELDEEWSIPKVQKPWYRRLSLRRIFGNWQPSTRWSVKKDGLRAVLELIRAFIGYILDMGGGKKVPAMTDDARCPLSGATFSLRPEDDCK